MSYLLVLFSIVLFGSGLLLLGRALRPASDAWNRLVKLVGPANSLSNTEEIDWEDGAHLLSLVQNRFGRAGFLSATEQQRARKLLGLIVAVTSISVAAFLFVQSGPARALLGLFVGAYVGLMLALYWLKWNSREFERKLLFHIPLMLEELILLVESGLGVLPAVQKIVANDKHCSKNPAEQFLHIAYELTAHGLPFGQALEMVSDAAEHKILRHVLLHLDISSSEGGELIPSLRSLSDHSHTTWKLSVEGRVKRLENLVVFPVFASVIGLMLLTAAVPLVPVIKLQQSLSSGGYRPETIPSGVSLE